MMFVKNIYMINNEKMIEMNNSNNQTEENKKLEK